MVSKRILVLDDEPNIGGSLRLILEREGYSVTLARSIADAKSVADRADLLLLDVRLPDGSGIEFLKQLRERECFAPAIMISGHGTIAEAVAATRAGAFDFLENRWDAIKSCCRSKTHSNRPICAGRMNACASWWHLRIRR